LVYFLNDPIDRKKNIDDVTSYDYAGVLKCHINTRCRPCVLLESNKNELCFYIYSCYLSMKLN